MMKLIRTSVRKQARGESGSTLIEVLAAMVLLSIGILGMAPLMTLSVSSNQFATQVNDVVATAQQNIEQRIRIGGFGTMRYRDTTSVRDGRFAVTTLVHDETVDANIPSKLYQIEVIVSWEDDVNVARTMTFTTYTPKP